MCRQSEALARHTRRKAKEKRVQQKRAQHAASSIHLLETAPDTRRLTPSECAPPLHARTHIPTHPYPHTHTHTCRIAQGVGPLDVWCVYALVYVMFVCLSLCLSIVVSWLAACVRVCILAYCVRACVHACVRVCVRACVRACCLRRRSFDYRGICPL